MSCVSSGKYTQNFTYFTQVATVIRHQAASPPNIDRSTVLIKAHRFLGTHECALLSQTASRSIQPFLWDSRCAQHADTQTSDRATKFCSSRLRLLRPDDAAWSFSQHMNWTQLAWKKQVNPVTPIVNWSCAQSSESASRSTLSKPTWYWLTTGCRELGRVVLNTCIPTGLFSLEFATSSSLTATEFGVVRVVWTSV